MKKLLLVTLAALPLAISGLVYANTGDQAKQGAFNCPLTGEELPCPKCCPLGQ